MPRTASESSRFLAARESELKTVTKLYEREQVDVKTTGELHLSSRRTKAVP